MLKVKEEIYYRCKKCGDEIYWNTHKKYTQCSCGALGVDGCEDYIRITGNVKDHIQVLKPKKA